MLENSPQNLEFWSTLRKYQEVKQKESINIQDQTISNILNEEEIKQKNRKKYEKLYDNIEKDLKEFLNDKGKGFDSFVITPISKKNDDFASKMIITILIQEYYSKFYLTYHIKINLVKNKLNMKCIIIYKNFSSLTVDYPLLKLLLTRYFTRMNWTFRYGCFTTNTNTGEFYFKINSIIDETIFNYNEQKMEIEGKTFESNLKKYLNITFTTAKGSIDFHILKILFLINKISEGEYKYIEQEILENNPSFPISNFRKIYSEHPEKMRFFKNISKYNNQKEYFIKPEDVDKLINDNNQKITKIQEELTENIFNYPDEFNKLIDINQKFIGDFNEWKEKEKDFIKNLKEIQTSCKEERLLDELLDLSNETYKKLKIAYYSFRCKENELFSNIIFKSNHLKKTKDFLESLTKNFRINPKPIWNEKKEILDLENSGKTDKIEAINDYFSKFNDIIDKLNKFNEVYELFCEKRPIEQDGSLNYSILFGRKNELNPVNKDQKESDSKKQFSLEAFLKIFETFFKIIVSSIFNESLLLDKIFEDRNSENSEKKTKILSNLFQYRNLIMNIQELNDQKEYCAKYIDFFKLPKQTSRISANSKNPPQLPASVYTKLDNIIVKDSKIFSVGGFAEIYKGNATLTIGAVEYKDKILIEKRGKIKKMPLGQDIFSKEKEELETETVQRIRNEKEILEILSNKECPYIARFYSCDNNGQYKDSLFVEYYHYKSLDQFKAFYSPTMSLNTKIYILYQIAQAVKFLKDQGIYHLDLKPGNILLSKNYVVKVIDFGESVNKKNEAKLKDHKPGRTLPFAPPEILSSELIKYNDSIDVFSFGVLMCDLIFDEYIVDFRRSHLHLLQEKYRRGTYKVRLLEEIAKLKGPKHIMKLLRFMIICCSEFEGENRASIEWIIVLLREVLGYLEKMY